MVVNTAYAELSLISKVILCMKFSLKKKTLPHVSGCDNAVRSSLTTSISGSCSILEVIYTHLCYQCGVPLEDSVVRELEWKFGKWSHRSIGKATVRMRGWVTERVKFRASSVMFPSHFYLWFNSRFLWFSGTVFFKLQVVTKISLVAYGQHLKK